MSGWEFTPDQYWEAVRSAEKTLAKEARGKVVISAETLRLLLSALGR